ncbi:MAG: type I DNA topoisomerase [Polyangiaceae bacterium]|nr:type I DNA topoisomerase [Polyangiaceae bacterium]
MTALVIVESPAKAKTIGGYLGPKFIVLASFGHVRDLPERADEVPLELKKQKWAKLGVNVESNFEPLYIVPDDKRRHVDSLRKLSKEVDEVLLATDEDREGESISWHITQVLKLPKKVPVRRIVFHEVTPEAIREAIDHPREIDENLVRAQETRRILDRLYGYTLSPVLWKKVAPKLSAGRVQSVSVKLLVERERERRRFHSAEYWDLEVELAAKENEKAFTAKLQTVGEKRVASGKHFDATTGELADKDVLLLGKEEAGELAVNAWKTRPWKVVKIEARPEQERPPVPFMTSTLQQESNRKLRFTSKRTMQIAQQLYEGVELRGGERVGLITYMRTDSLTLSERALTQAREVIADLYGKEYLPADAQRYKNKSKNAQEAHEGIRPTDLSRRPEQLKGVLDPDAFKLYELIWKRTIACQMLPARVQRTQAQFEVVVSGKALRFSASGKQVVFPGFLRAYVEGSDDPEAELGGEESMLPPLAEGQEMLPMSVLPLEHHTKPPARLTEATLVKRLEELGVGRPSTYASIISTVQDRGYVFKHGNELVPTFTAFAVTEVLEKHFAGFVDVKFTAKMEDQLDEIANGTLDHVTHLTSFYKGEAGRLGLVEQVEKETPSIAYPAILLGTDPEGTPLVVRVGRYGTFVQRGEGGKENTVSIPEDTLPADLKVSDVLELLRRKAMGPVAVGTDEATGRDVFLRTGRFGSYLEVAQTAEEVEREEKPRRASLPEGFDPSSLTEAIVRDLLAFPKVLGNHPESNEPVVVNLGRYGAYIRCATDTRNVGAYQDALALTLDKALEILKMPKMRRGKVAVVRVALKEFPKTEQYAAMSVYDGKYGMYVSNGETNATLPKGMKPEELTVEEALRIIAERERMAPTKRRRGGRGARGAKGGRFGAKAGGEETSAKPAKKAAAPKAAKKAAKATVVDGPPSDATPAKSKAKPAKKAAKRAAKKPAAK